MPKIFIGTNILVYSLASDAALPIYQDRHGHVWVGHFGSGLDRYNPDTDDFIHHKPDSKDPTSLPHGYPAGFFETHRLNSIGRCRIKMNCRNLCRDLIWRRACRV
jgi:hypothetical protein